MVAVAPGRGGRVPRQRKCDAVLRLLRGGDLEAMSCALGVGDTHVAITTYAVLAYDIEPLPLAA